jgi:hypothetical protein
MVLDPPLREKGQYGRVTRERDPNGPNQYAPIWPARAINALADVHAKRIERLTMARYLYFGI